MKGRRRETRRGKRRVIVYVLYFSRRQREIKKTAMRHKRGELNRSDRKSERETMVCTQNTRCDTNEGGEIEVTVTSELGISTRTGI